MEGEQKEAAEVREGEEGVEETVDDGLVDKDGFSTANGASASKA